MTPLLKIQKLMRLITASKALFPKDWLAINSSFFHDDYLYSFSKNCIEFHENSISKNPQSPLFSEEVTPKLDVCFSSFETTISELETKKFNCDANATTLIFNAIKNAPFEHILLLMGQRQTSATLKTIEGLPLTKNDMLESCLTPYNKQISVGVRAWEKHIDRSEDGFWGALKGSPEHKQNKVKDSITHIINNYTWWNTFHHYKHNIVFEIRVKSGHGMRWSKNDKSLIGFLEPFL